MTSIANLVDHLRDRRSLRDIVFEYLEEQSRHGEVTTHTLLVRAKDRFRSDPEFIEAAMAEALPGIVQRYVSEFFHEQREQARGRRFPKRDATAQAKRVMENVGTGEYRSIWKMTRKQMQYARDQRQRTVDGHQTYIGLYDELLPVFRNDHAEVGDLFKGREGEFQRIWDKHFG